MGNRSNINLVGNTTQGQNLGAGDACVFKEKYAGNTLRFRSIVGSGDTTVTETDEQIIIWSSGGTGGSGTGLTTALNGLTDDGTNVCLGGTLITDTMIDADVNLLTVCNDNVKFVVDGWNNCIGLRAEVPATITSCILVSTGATAMYTWGGTESQAEIFTNPNGLVYICSGSGSTDTYLNMRPSCVCVYSNSPSFKGMQYAADYSANYTDRSLIDKGYFAAHSGGSGSYTFTNGLVNNSGTVCLGAPLTTNTAICLTSGSLTLQETSVGTSYQFANSGMILSKCNSCIYLTNNGADFKLVSCYGKCVNLNNSGLTYGADYSANFSSRSLVDKAYVDSKVGGGGGIGWSNLANGSTVAGCGTIASGATICKNTFYGVCAGASTTTGCGNVAIGVSALTLNALFHQNIAIGDCALTHTDGGGANIGIGACVLHNNTSGCGNVAIGHSALLSNLSGYTNVAIGYQALLANTCGLTNVAVGSCALVSNLCGCYNVAVGGGALYYNTNGHRNVANGFWASYCNTTGCNNVSGGYQALWTNRTGNDNIAIGWQSVYSNISGGNNVGLGCQALYKVTGSNNIGIGCFAGYGITTGANNIAIGIGAFGLSSCSIANANIAIGGSAMGANTSGCANSAIGFFNLNANTIGSRNVALGFNSMIFNTSGCENTGLGNNSVYSNTTGCGNVGVGYLAFTHNKTGNFNTVIGTCAGYGVTVSGGSRNVFIGCGAGTNETGSDMLYIANCATTWLVKGDFAGNTICNAANSTAWNTTSDVRIKENIQTISNAVDELTKLNPVTYDYTKNYSENRNWDDCMRICNYGFIAQEFEQIFPKYVTKSTEIVDGIEVDDFRSINDGHLVPLLVKAIQEQQVQINNLCERIIQLGG